ncbi:hypothetical protein E2C01_042205 [Portunus trituberculatus]|uniref:Uncharacterized protein n=1 Tax=Portunus trituberculatus TaxID=210409 RepID=A0A5B7FPK3_PORTR|nr:hypothetical protein [Portunus trituberculatus]
MGSGRRPRIKVVPNINRNGTNLHQMPFRLHSSPDTEPLLYEQTSTARSLLPGYAQTHQSE